MAFVSVPAHFSSSKTSSHLLSPTKSLFNITTPRRPSSSRLHRNFVAPSAVYKAKSVGADELEKVLLANERPILVDAYAPWCGPCQILLPQLDVVAEHFQDRLDILKLDTEKYPDLASALRVRGLPTLFFIKDGKLRYRMEGAIPADELTKLIDYVLFDGPPPANVEPNPQQPATEVDA